MFISTMLPLSIVWIKTVESSVGFECLDLLHRLQKGLGQRLGPWWRGQGLWSRRQESGSGWSVGGAHHGVVSISGNAEHSPRRPVDNWCLFSRLSSLFTSQLKLNFLFDVKRLVVLVCFRAFAAAGEASWATTSLSSTLLSFTRSSSGLPNSVDHVNCRPKRKVLHVSISWTCSRRLKLFFCCKYLLITMAWQF